MLETNERKLCTIRTVTDILPHGNADALELAMIDGWQAVVKKGEFKQGDTVLYVEADAVLPIHPVFEFLRKSCYVKRDWIEGFRLKTIKLRGERSQGLILSVSILKNFTSEPLIPSDTDLDSLIGIVKWDPPLDATLRGQAKGNFPSFIPKTNQERVQNMKFHSLDAEPGVWEVTEKLDGTSGTFYVRGEAFGVCSRNLELKIGEENEDNTYVRIALGLGLEQKIRSTGRNLAVQGEIVGPAIQKNPYGLKTPELFVFDIFDIDAQDYVRPHERHLLLEQMKLKSAPVIGIKALPDTLQALLEVADGKSVLNPSVAREGYVYKHINKDVSFKVISNEWLLNEE